MCFPMLRIVTGRNVTLLGPETLVQSLLSSPGKHRINSFKTLEDKIQSIPLIHISEFFGCSDIYLILRAMAISSPGWRKDSLCDKNETWPHSPERPLLTVT